jgi:hypothetical protein
MNSGGGAAAISRTEQGVGACGEPVVIGFVARMVRGADVLIQLVKAGFGRLSNSIEDQMIAAFGSSYRGSHFKCMSCRRLRSFDLQATKSPPIGGLLVFSR